MIRRCEDKDFDAIVEIVNDGAQAYKGVIPEDRWHDPYMSPKVLRDEIEDGVLFWGYEEEGKLAGVMGIQDKTDVTLIRHAYVRTCLRNHGIGGKLLRFLESTTAKPILIGTWAAATWAIAFYEKNGYRLLEKTEKDRLLQKYWTIPERQVETSVVLAKGRWKGVLNLEPD
ncbi:MAG: GNAT family N-acetyltransferase [Deltaproteobacteria bacterium HGW-Deltaproteobacteria-15]|nr:MAG: GNAT family N-acetyltransferase [Deltaproteobacteria bacterium HGW-Deltaproteobacteria-15]